MSSLPSHTVSLFLQRLVRERGIVSAPPESPAASWLPVKLGSQMILKNHEHLELPARTPLHPSSFHAVWGNQPHFCEGQKGPMALLPGKRLSGVLGPARAYRGTSAQLSPCFGCPGRFPDKSHFPWGPFLLLMGAEERKTLGLQGIFSWTVFSWPCPFPPCPVT